ncbi:hypothetical protein WJX73_005138 [Symbiochloris irregularis]|uniref:Mitochondrial import receptor subunit TOM40 n=1 Tax=Symbiochloris irregularis TaxID=706552 RepID=A0AAW1P4U3_9CHLO
MGGGPSKPEELARNEELPNAQLPHRAAAFAQAQAAATGLAPPPPATQRLIDYKRLPSPVRYEELQKEAYMSLKPELFEGLRFDFTKPLNQNFGISHNIFLGNVEVPAQSQSVVKVSHGTYEFGANLISNQGNFMIGRIQTDGRLMGRAKYDINSMFSLKAQLSLSEPEMSQGMIDIDAKGSDWNSQLKLGNQSFYGLNYFQSVTPHLSMGGEMFWLGKQRKSGVGFAARWQNEFGHTATGQVASTGLANLTYLHKVSDKICLASDFMWNWNMREATASFGYDYIFRQGRLRGRIDTDGKIGALLEERINVAVTFSLSAEVDHVRKDYKFGFGLTLGE